MPIYTYKCQNGHTQTLMRSMDYSAEPIGCKECAQLCFRVIDLPSAPHVHMGTPTFHKGGSK